MKHDFRFQPVEIGILWGNLRLTQAQVVQLCGVTRRQFGHWVSRGYVVPASRTPPRFGAQAIEQVALIKQALDAGFPLQRAVRMADAYLAGRRSAGPRDGRFPTPTIVEIEGRLLAAEAAIHGVLDLLQPLPARGSPDGAVEQPREQAGTWDVERHRP